MTSDYTPRTWFGRFEKALIVEHPDPTLDDYLRKLGIEPHRLSETPSEEELIKVLEEGQHDLLYKRSRVQVTEDVVKASERLAGVMLCCIGHDSVDKAACAEHGVLVTHDPVSNGRSVAELVVAEMITASRRIPESISEMAHSDWRKNNTNRFEVMGKTLGIVGLGKIGRQVAQLGESLGMTIHFYDNDPVAVEVGSTLGWTAEEELTDLFRVADVVTVHVSAEDIFGNSNEGLITYEHFEALGDKEGRSPRLFLNLARGVIHTPDDLRKGVENGHVGYAFVDVFPDEPRSKDDTSWKSPYEGEPHVYATPHIGAATQEAQPRIAKYVARTTQDLSCYGALRNCVYMPKATIALSLSLSRYFLAVVHADQRGTKRALDEAIYEVGANNLQSAHVDFPKWGIAYDLSALDRPLSPDEVQGMIDHIAQQTGNPSAIRSIRVIDASR